MGRAGTRGENGFSGRIASGLDIAIEFGRHQPGPEDLSFSAAGLRLQGDEGTEEVVSEKCDEQKAFNGAGIMLEHMIGESLVYQIRRNRNSRCPIAGSRNGWLARWKLTWG